MSVILCKVVFFEEVNISSNFIMLLCRNFAVKLFKDCIHCYREMSGCPYDSFYATYV